MTGGKGFKRQNRMIYRPESPVCDKTHRQMTRSDIIYCIEIIGQRHHQSAGTLNKHHIEFLRQTTRTFIYNVDINLPAVYRRG